MCRRPGPHTAGADYIAARRRPLYTDGMADKPIAALDYLAKPEKHPPRPVCAVFGDEAFLRRQVILGLRGSVLGGDDGDFSLSTFDGRDAVLRDVLDELAIVAMFGGGRRLALVEDADPFVSRYREDLEDYVARPGPSGVLVIELDSFPAATRLYKSIAAEGLLVDCRVPAPGPLTKWLADWAKQRHQVQIPPAAADQLIETVGSELGLLDQELAKLALLAGDDRKITAELVERSAGGWRVKSAWDMLDAALDGNVPQAMLQLDRLLGSGEQPVGLLGQISASLRRFAAATRLVLQAEAKKGSGPICRNGPPGAAHKLDLTPFSPGAVPGDRASATGCGGRGRPGRTAGPAGRPSRSLPGPPARAR